MIKTSKSKKIPNIYLFQGIEKVRELPKFFFFKEVNINLTPIPDKDNRKKQKQKNIKQLSVLTEEKFCSDFTSPN